MIELDRSEKSAPYIKFYSLYDKCINQNQNHPEAIAISTYDQLNQQTDIRYVNLKYIMGDKWIFLQIIILQRLNKLRHTKRYQLLFIGIK